MNITVGVIGAGALGTAISQNISGNVAEIILLLRNKELCDEINNCRYNSQYYPNYKLKDNIKATLEVGDLSNCDIIFLAIPSSAFRKTLKDLQDIVKKRCYYCHYS